MGYNEPGGIQNEWLENLMLPWAGNVFTVTFEDHGTISIWLPDDGGEPPFEVLRQAVLSCFSEYDSIVEWMRPGREPVD